MKNGFDYIMDNLSAKNSEMELIKKHRKLIGRISIVMAWLIISFISFINTDFNKQIENVWGVVTLINISVLVTVGILIVCGLLIWLLVFCWNGFEKPL